MFVRNIKEFKKKTNKKKIICLDYGKKRVGLAISDENHKISMPIQTLKKNKIFNEKLREVMHNLEIGGMIIGLPINDDNYPTKQSQSIRDISKNIDSYLKKHDIDIPILFWDESYTSIEAEDLTKNFFKNKKQQKKYLDKFAAKIILDDFINYNIDDNE